MPFTERFQLLDLKRDEGARTFEAREIATGRPVFVHLFADTTSPINRALLAKLDRLPEEERRRIIDRGPFEGGVYLVTDQLAEYGGLREWLRAKHEQKPLDARGAWQLKPPPALTNSGEQTLLMPAPLETPAAARPAPAPGEPGEFTRQFAPPVQRPVPAPAPSSTPVANEPGEFTRQFAPPVLRPTPPPAAQPGEFTQLFAATPPKLATPPQPGEFTRQFQAPQRPVRAPAQNPPSESVPGEFTQMLQAQRPAAPPPSSKQPSPTGEFTRYFQSPMTPQGGQPQAAPLGPPRPPTHAPSHAPSHAKDASEFTQIFGQDRLPSPPPVPAPANPASANATQVFATPRPMVHPPLPAQAIDRGPGEYTQMFAKPASLTLGQAPAGPQTPRAAEPAPIKGNNSRLPLLLVIGAIVLLIVAIFVFFVTRQHAI